MLKIVVMGCKKFIFILTLSVLYSSAAIAEENKVDNYENFDIDDDFYKNFDQIKIYDPYEKFNRSVFKFNKVVDRFILRPPAKIYHVIAPSPVKRRVSSFISNLSEPLNMVYGIMQLKPKVAFDSFFRFFINSTFGILGLFDFAESAGLKKQNISFGRVLQYYGAKEGPYLVLPILGPSTTRDGIGTIIDISADPVNFVKFKDRVKFRNYYYGTTIIVEREKLIGPDKTLSEISLDEYAALRNFYYQKLIKQSGGGY
jgi:phospholipid-binding lipoprotein MlaA